MKLIFKQKLFSWFDSYKVFTEDRHLAYEVKGQLSWGHCQKIYDAHGHELGKVDEKVISLVPKFEIFEHGKKVGQIKRKIFSLFGPAYEIDFLGWKVQGNVMEWDYTIKDKHNKKIATVSKALFNITDTYVLNIENPEHALYVLMFVIAIDAEKCSRDND